MHFSFVTKLSKQHPGKLNSGKSQLIYHISISTSTGPSSWFKHSKSTVVFSYGCCKTSAICCTIEHVYKMKDVTCEYRLCAYNSECDCWILLELRTRCSSRLVALPGSRLGKTDRPHAMPRVRGFILFSDFQGSCG